MHRDLLEVRRKLRGLADAAAAKFTQAVAKTPYQVLGIRAPDLRRIARQVIRRHRHNANLRPVLEIAARLWKSPIHEEMSTAIYMLSMLDRRLENRHWRVFKGWMKRVKTWDHCDGIAAWLIGALVTRDRSWVRVLRHWGRSKNIWDRRASVVGVLLRVRQMSDVEAALWVCEPLMRDPESMVQKAVGWILKEAMSVDPVATQEFLDRYRDKTSALILRTATENIREPKVRRSR